LSWVRIKSYPYNTSVLYNVLHNVVEAHLLQLVLQVYH
jgi:hypothetical protein